MNTPARPLSLRHNFHRLGALGLARYESRRYRRTVRNHVLALLAAGAFFTIIFAWSYLP